MPDTLDLDQVARAIADEAERRRNIARAEAHAAAPPAEGLHWRLTAIDNTEAITLEMLEQVRAYLEPR